KRNHRVLGHKRSRVSLLQLQLDFLAEKETRVRDLVAHLDEVLDGEVGNGFCVPLAQLLEFREQSRPVGAEPIEQFKKISAVLEGAIHSLPEKPDDSMRGVAQQKRPA